MSTKTAKEGNGRRRALKVIAGVVVVAIASVVVGILKIFPTGQEPASNHLHWKCCCVSYCCARLA